MGKFWRRVNDGIEVLVWKAARLQLLFDFGIRDPRAEQGN